MPGRGAQPGRDVVAVEGLNQFVSALRKLSTADPKAINRVNERIADRVIERAEQIARQAGPQQAAAAETLKALKAARRVQIKLGNRRKGGRSSQSRAGAFALGAEFGAYPRTAKDGHRFNRFKPWSGNQHVVFKVDGPGYFLYPAIRSLRDDIADWYSEALADLSRGAFPD